VSILPLNCLVREARFPGLVHAASGQDLDTVESNDPVSRTR